jgi:4-aminobutyrate aminotransferase-like enzyme
MTTNADIVNADKAIIFPTFGVPLAPVAIEEGNGARGKDVEGKEYVNLLGSAAVGS